MSSPRDEFALLLAAPNPVEAELARDLLAAQGIPSVLHGQDRDLAELGAAIHSGVARPDLLVPKSSLERARALIQDAWDEASLTDSVALAASNHEDEEPKARRSAFLWVLFVALAVLAIAFAYSHFAARSL